MLLANIVTSVLISATNTITVHSDNQGYYVLDDGSTNGIVRVEIVPKSLYDLLTGKVDKVWATYHSTRSGRESLHGKVKRTVVNEDVRTITEIHEDGYIHIENMKKIARDDIGRRKSVSIRNPPIRMKPSNMSPRQWKKKIESENKKTKTVTIEFAPGGKPTREIK